MTSQPDLDPAIARARAQLHARDTADRKRTLRVAAGLAVVLTVVAVGLVRFAYLFEAHPLKSPIAVGVALLAVFVLLIAAVGPFLMIALQRARASHHELSQAEFESIDNAAESIQDQPLGKLVSFNFRLMDRFVGVALGQAKAAYVFCAAATSAALLVLLGGTAAFVAADSAGQQVTVAVLTVAGSTFSGYVSITFMATFKATSQHMQYYYGQPLVHCYLLHAEWLAKRAAGADTALYAELHQKLMSNTLGASRNAQVQLSALLGLPEPTHPDAHDAGLDGRRADGADGRRADGADGRRADGADGRRADEVDGRRADGGAGRTDPAKRRHWGGQTPVPVRPASVDGDQVVG